MSNDRTPQRRGYRPARTLAVESLEVRCLLHGGPAWSIALNGNVLEVEGDKRSNVIDVSLNESNRVIVRVDGQTDPANPAGFDPAQVQSIQIHGLRGHDRITIDASLDRPTTITGDVGNDTITGGPGIDTVDGGPGRDSITGGNGNDWLAGGTSHDALLGGGGNDTLGGGPGNDILNGEDGNDSLQADAGRDIHTGGSGADDFGLIGKGDQRTDFTPGTDFDAANRLRDFSLEDLNPNSATFGQNIGPSVFRGNVSAYYFTHAG